MKSQNFKEQAEITSRFAVAFTGPVPLLCANKLTPADRDTLQPVEPPVEDLTHCLDVCPQQALNSPPKVHPLMVYIKAMAKQSG